MKNLPVFQTPSKGFLVIDRNASTQIGGLSALNGILRITYKPFDLFNSCLHVYLIPQINPLYKWRMRLHNHEFEPRTNAILSPMWGFPEMNTMWLMGRNYYKETLVILTSHMKELTSRGKRGIVWTARGDRSSYLTNAQLIQDMHMYQAHCFDHLAVTSPVLIAGDLSSYSMKDDLVLISWIRCVQSPASWEEPLKQIMFWIVLIHWYMFTFILFYTWSWALQSDISIHVVFCSFFPEKQHFMSLYKLQESVETWSNRSLPWFVNLKFSPSNRGKNKAIDQV